MGYSTGIFSDFGSFLKMTVTENFHVESTLMLFFSAGEWSKLQSSHVKPHWIKVDFDHFHVSEDEDDEDNDKMEELMKRKALQRVNLIYEFIYLFLFRS